VSTDQGLKALAVAVISQALEDLSSIKEIERRQARAWLLNGDHLSYWCELAGLDKGNLQRVVRAAGPEQCAAMRKVLTGDYQKAA
jgi:hypothetical protein